VSDFFAEHLIGSGGGSIGCVVERDWTHVFGCRAMLEDWGSCGSAWIGQDCSHYALKQSPRKGTEGESPLLPDL